MKFAHMADTHLGAWSSQEMKKLVSKAFEKAIDRCIGNNVDFILISGDLLETSRPSTGALSTAAKKLREVNDAGIDVYLVPGSHDFSPSGNTMLNVLQSADLIENVVRGKPTDDGKLLLKFTRAREEVKITGMPGRKRSLESKSYEELDREGLEKEDGFKVFMFHSALDEYKPEIYKEMDSLPLSLLPKNFDYYAGGHVHKKGVFEEDRYPKIVFPGSLFPVNFKELEEFENGGFYIVEVNNGELDISREEIEVCDIVSKKFDAQNKSPEEINNQIKNTMKDLDVRGKVVTIRVKGTLKSGRTTELNLGKIKSILIDRGAVSVKSNTRKLSTKEYEEVKVKADDKNELEDKLIKENIGQFELEDYSKQEKVELAKNLYQELSDERNEGEKKKDYRSRVAENVIQTLDLKQKMEQIL
ncbi:MAG: DNA repair exonuclease SbcD [Candidatus Methanohalarchaeum thermophilum]|uniref:DNA repair exonuclease SbcD n=1 Tax=Methanohalarchaeum thermophilum TaxID=1903181 RepID=A0A1Q6DWL4_METT1|nr:MAG: DNA repair exonuclease SbcD [Candidatus Methanohalarchaeum thermophilum]